MDGSPRAEATEMMESADPKQKYQQADRLYREKKYAEALAILDELDRTYPNTKNILYLRALCFAALGRVYEAGLLCNRLTKEFRDSRGEELKTKLATRRARDAQPRTEPTRTDAPAVSPNPQDSLSSKRHLRSKLMWAAAVTGIVVIAVLGLFALGRNWQETEPLTVATPADSSLSQPDFKGDEAPPSAEPSVSAATTLERQWGLEKGSLSLNPYGYEVGVDHYQLGLEAMADKNYEVARSALQRALAIRPDDAKAHFCLAVVHDEQGERKTALFEAGETIEQDPSIKQWAPFWKRFGSELTVEEHHSLTDHTDLLVSALEDLGNLQAAPLRVDKTFNGNPLTIDGRRYAKGLGTHANSSIVFRLPRGTYDAFKCVVGPDDESFWPHDPMAPSVRFHVYTDGREAFRSGVLTRGQSERVNVSLRGIEELELVVDNADNRFSHDHADWATPELISMWINEPDHAEEGRMNVVGECEERIAADPANANLHNELGLVLMSRGEYTQALAKFNEAVGIDPAFAPAHTNAALALSVLNLPAEASESWARRAQIAIGNTWDSRATEVLDPSTLKALLRKLPELKDGQTSDGVAGLYKQLVAALPADSARWILDMGQFVEDRTINSPEKGLLEFLVHAKDPLIYLTSWRIMDGVDREDVAWAKQWSPTKGDYFYLEEDLVQLEELRLLGSDIRPALKALVAMSNDDFEIRKGLYLVFNYGHPAEHVSEYTFNTQFLMLCHLLHYGLQEGEERLAIAAALDYGSVLSISEQTLWPRIIDYVRHRLDFISETTKLLSGEDVDWDPQKYPLQACIGLVWGANCQGERDENQLGQYFQERRMDREAFGRVFVQANTMVEFRDWLLAKGIFSNEEDFRRLTAENPRLGPDFYSRVSAAADLGIRLSWQRHLWHPDDPVGDVNWQWRYFKDCDSFCGHCRSTGAVGAFLIRSLNIAVLQRCHVYWHYVPQDDVWRSDARELALFLEKQSQGAGFSGDVGHIVYHKLDWDNFHLGFEMGGGGTNDYIMVLYGTEDQGRVVEGIPAGYVFRKSLPVSWPRDYWSRPPDQWNE